MAASVPLLVGQALEHGSLQGLGYGKSITVEGKRRITIRVQCDIFAAVHSRGDVQLYYPELAPAINAEVDSWRAARRARA